jgi:hypothetical protein
LTVTVSAISLDDEDFSDPGRRAAHCDTEAFEAFEALTAA